MGNFEDRRNNRSGNRDNRSGNRDNRSGNRDNRSGNRDNRSGGGFNRGYRNNFEPREMHDAVCDECKKECKVPFKPTEGKPVYCKECYVKRKPSY